MINFWLLLQKKIDKTKLAACIVILFFFLFFFLALVLWEGRRKSIGIDVISSICSKKESTIVRKLRNKLLKLQ